MDFGVSDKKSDELRERMQRCQVDESDLKERFIRSQGPGGQHVNKTSTCVELTHASTGHIVKMQKARSQTLNRFYARRRLCELIEQDRLGTLSPQAKRIAKLRKQKDRRKRRQRKKTE
jgi:peptide chain release factor